MFNLINILGQNTLPEQVEINKQNIAILADEVEKLGYQPKGVYDAETEYNHNDVVFYDNKLYVVTSDAAIVGVLPTNTTYWQQVTGDIRGQQGAPGAQGPAGADGQDGAAGANGKSALAYTVIHLGSVPQIGGTMELRKAYFTRDPELNEKCTVFIADSFLNRSYIYITEVRIAAISGETVTVAVQQRYSLQGVQGEAGAPALVYDRKIDFVWNEQSQQLINASLPIANFNRTPNLNEDFVAVLHDTVSGVDYLAMGEVQTIAGTSVTSIVATDINRITGVNGTNGTNGVDGEPALETAEEFSGAADAVLEQTLTMSNVYFNRTPKVHDALVVIYRNGMTGDMFIGNVRISAVGEVTTTGYFESIPRKITGAAGTPLQRFDYYVNTASQAAYNKILNIVKNAKGRVSGYFQYGGVAIPIYFDIQYPTNTLVKFSGFQISSDMIRLISCAVDTESVTFGGRAATIKYDGTAVATTNISGIDLNLHISYFNDTEITA